MKLLDTLLGRTPPVKADLDALFALPTAAITLQSAAGVAPTGWAGVCFKASPGQPFARTQTELKQLLGLTDDGEDPVTVNQVDDSFGYRWIVLHAEGIEDLVTRVHMVHASLADGGWDTQLLCSVFGFAPGAPDDPATEVDPDVAAADEPLSLHGALYLVYLAKRGTFYPFAPSGPTKRDTELELRIRAVLGGDLPVESELDRWFPLWDLPIAAPGVADVPAPETPGT
jgi:hypothetical protein